MTPKEARLKREAREAVIDTIWGTLLGGGFLLGTLYMLISWIVESCQYGCI